MQIAKDAIYTKYKEEEKVFSLH